MSLVHLEARHLGQPADDLLAEARVPGVDTCVGAATHDPSETIYLLISSDLVEGKCLFVVNLDIFCIVKYSLHQTIYLGCSMQYSEYQLEF